MMRKVSLLAAALALAAAAMAPAQDTKRAARITGFLIDVMCAAPSDRDAKAHAVSCAKMPDCEKSGFAVVSKDVVYKLDEEGNRRALAIVRETKTKKGLAVEVEGTLVGETLHVDSIAEVQPH